MEFDEFGNPLPEDDLLAQMAGLAPDMDEAQPPPYLMQMLAGGGGGGTMAAPVTTGVPQPAPTPDARIAAEQARLENLIPRKADAVPRNTPALAYILGGLQDALALGSMMRKPQKRQYYTGRHGADRKPVMATYYEEPNRVPTAPFGAGGAAAYFGPKAAYQREQADVQKYNDQRGLALARMTNDFAGSAAMRPMAAPAPPPPPAWLNSYRTMKQLEDAGVVEKGSAQKILAHAANGNITEAKKSIMERMADAKAAGDMETYRMLEATVKDYNAAGRAPTVPKPPPPTSADKDDAALATKIYGERKTKQSGYVQTLRNRLTDAQTEITRLEAQKAKMSEAGGMDVSGAPVSTDAIDNQLRIKRQYAAKLEEQIGKGGYEMTHVAGGTAPGYLDFTEGGIEGADAEADAGAATPAVEAGFDMQLSDGSQFSEWTEDDWRKLRTSMPDAYNRLMTEIAASATAPQ